MTEKEFTSLSHEVLDRLKMWSSEIDIPSISTLLSEEEKKRKSGEIDPVYWFLRAPIDLAGAGGD